MESFLGIRQQGFQDDVDGVVACGPGEAPCCFQALVLSIYWEQYWQDSGVLTLSDPITLVSLPSGSLSIGHTLFSPLELCHGPS